jgi:hypothetical protein
MHRIHRTRRTRAGAGKAAAVVALLLLSSLGLAACGSSGSSTSASANAAATTGSGAGAAASGTTGPGADSSGPTGPRSGRFAALRECLQKNGVTLPKRTPGQRPPGGFLGGATGLPNGVTRGQMQAALKKCGGIFGGGLRRFNNPGYKQALAKFATCMRENGVNVPEPNTSGQGPVFNTSGLNTNSAQFRTAELKCRADLRGSFRPGVGGAGTGTGGTG